MVEVFRVNVPEAPKTSSTRPPWVRSNCLATSVSAKFRFAAAAIVGGRWADTAAGSPIAIPDAKSQPKACLKKGGMRDVLFVSYVLRLSQYELIIRLY
jgi:hypothetical protein